MPNSFGTQATLTVGDRDYTIYRLDAVYQKFPQAARLPFSLKILLENLLRTEDGVNVTPEDIEALAQWDAKAEPDKEIAFTPARVLLQDFTGVPAVVDLAAMRDAMKTMGGDPDEDQSAAAGRAGHRSLGAGRRLRHRRRLPAQRRAGVSSATRSATPSCAGARSAFRNFKVVPPETGIVHQVNLEYLARVVFIDEHGETARGCTPTRSSAPIRTRR